MHVSPLITTVVVGLVLAFILGAIANRLRMPPLVGYLIAGVMVGPYTPGFVGNTELALELADVGVVLLMFGVGLNFSLKDLISVQALAIPGALGRMAAGTLMGLGLALTMGWSLGAGLIFGLALSVASTVVLLKALQDRHLVDSERGRIAIGWVIVEDIAMVLALVMIPALAGLGNPEAVAANDPFVNFVERLSGVQLNLFAILSVTVVKLAAFVGFMLVVGRRVIPWILHVTAHTGSRELFRLAVLAIALGVAVGAAYLFGVSLALGAFFAGMILSESELSQRAAQESLPLRDAFAVLFFVSVGMLFDPTILVRSPLPVLATLFIIVFGKSVVAYGIVVAFGRSPSSALTISASLAQVGEFSFILAALGVSLAILPPEGRDLILAGSILSIIVNPALMWAVDRIKPQLEARQKARDGIAPRTEPDLVAGAAVEPVAAEADAGEEQQPTHKRSHIVLIGFGRVGGVVGEGLLASQVPFVLIEDAEGRVQAAKALGIEVIEGNAASARTLELANVEAAKAVLIAIPNAFEAGQATEQCRRHNPGVRIIARAHSEEEIEYLGRLGADHVIMGEREIGLGMLGWINGENDHASAVAQTAARLSAVATALDLAADVAKMTGTPEVAPKGVAVEPAPALVAAAEPISVATFEAAIAAKEDVPPEAAAEEDAGDVPEELAAEIAEKSPPARAAGPATKPAAPFNPEIPPESET